MATDLRTERGALSRCADEVDRAGDVVADVAGELLATLDLLARAVGVGDLERDVDDLARDLRRAADEVVTASRSLADGTRRGDLAISRTDDALARVATTAG